MAKLTCPHCGTIIIAGEPMTGRERAELRYLSNNPGIWGGPLDKGQEHTDPMFRSWIRDGLIEARKSPAGKWGYHITLAGRAALQATGAQDDR